jgi:hypothetical protein
VNLLASDLLSGRLLRDAHDRRQLRGVLATDLERVACGAGPAASPRLVSPSGR